MAIRISYRTSNHLAKAAASEVNVFVTRDQRLLKKSCADQRLSQPTSDITYGVDPSAK